MTSRQWGGVWALALATAGGVMAMPQVAQACSYWRANGCCSVIGGTAIACCGSDGCWCDCFQCYCP